MVFVACRAAVLYIPKPPTGKVVRAIAQRREQHKQKIVDVSGHNTSLPVFSFIPNLSFWVSVSKIIFLQSPNVSYKITGPKFLHKLANSVLVATVDIIHIHFDHHSSIFSHNNTAVTWVDLCPEHY